MPWGSVICVKFPCICGLLPHFFPLAHSTIPVPMPDYLSCFTFVKSWYLVEQVPWFYYYCYFCASSFYSWAVAIPMYFRISLSGFTKILLCFCLELYWFYRRNLHLYMNSFPIHEDVLVLITLWFCCNLKEYFKINLLNIIDHFPYRKIYLSPSFLSIILKMKQLC